jgi:hypothetical protein
MFDEDADTIILHEAAGAAGLNPMFWRRKWVLSPDGEPEKSSCLYLMPVVD